MKKINSITNDANQKLALVLDDGTKVNVTMQYWPNQQGWFYSLTYGSFSVMNRRMVNSPNILRQFRNIIPFGLCCTVVDGYEIVYLNDFTSGRCNQYVLNSADLSSTETLITRTIPEFVGYPLN